MPSAIVSAASTATGSPAAATRTTRSVDLHADDLDAGPRDLTAIATPAASPPPPTGTTTFARSGDVLEQLEPERALAGDDVGVVERVHERHAAPRCARARARLEARRRPTSPPRRTVGAERLGALDLRRAAPRAA